MVIVAVIAILAIIAIPKFSDMVRKSRDAATKGGLGAIRSALVIYYADNENHPYDLSLLTIDSKYLDKIPTAYTTWHDPTDTFRSIV